MKTKTITVEQLRERLQNVTGAMPISFVALTEAKLKAGHSFGVVRKLSKINAFVGFDYAGSVQKQQAREGAYPTFQAAERTWGTKVGKALIEHKGNYSLAAKVENSSRPIYMHSKDGAMAVLAKERLKEFLPAKSDPIQGGIEKKIIYRDFRLDNVISVNMGGERLRIRHGAVAKSKRSLAVLSKEAK